MKVALIIPVYNRFEYVMRCFDSLLKADLSGVDVIVVDDGSNEKGVKELHELIPWRLITQENGGVKSAMLTGYESTEADILINLDSDAIVKPEFIKRLLALQKQHPEHIISGFNCDNPANPIIETYSDYVVRKHVNGINMCFSRDIYNKWVKPALLKQGNWDFNSTPDNGVIITKPSVVQHIGIKSSMGHNTNPDFACDFKLLDLPDVTLFGIDAHDPEGIKRAAEISTKDVSFGAVKIITERLFSGREAYSKFCIQDMAAYIETSHVLIIHPDGYIQNPLAWDDSWLQYDYIGATWGYKDGKNVGNGGFSLRSKKLLDILAQCELDKYHPEDDIICRAIRPWLESEYGIRFAPEEVANKFAIEAYGSQVFKDTYGHPANQYTGQFGFHGYHVTGLPVPMKPKPIQQIQIPTKKRLVKGRYR